MYALISIAFIILIALAISRLLNRSLSETFPFTLFGVILLVYTFGLIGALSYSLYFIALLGLASLILLIFRRSREQTLHNKVAGFFSPDVLIVVGGGLLIVLFAAGRRVTDMDSFEQWAYVVKKMALTGSLRAAQGQYATTALYPPGIALLQYYTSSFSSVFSESTLFVGKNLLSFALLLPLLGRVERNKWKELLFLIPILVLLPFAEYATFDSSLEVDPMLGLLFGFLTLYGATTARTDWFYYTNLALGAFALSLTKTTGFLLCGFATLIVLFLRLQARAAAGHADPPIQKSVRWLLHSLCIAVAAALGAVSWMIYIRSSGIQLAQNSAFFLRGGLAQYQKEIIVNFLSAVFAPEGGAGLNALSPILWIFAIPVLSAVVVRLLTPDETLRRRSALGAVLLSLGYLIWMLLLLIGYLTSFVEGEAMALAAFSRYLSAYQLGALLVCAVWLTEAIRTKQPRLSHTLLLLCVCALAFVTPLRDVFNATIGSPYANVKTVDWRMSYEPSSRYYEILNIDSVKICYLDQNDKEPGFSFAMFQFEALPYDVQKAIAWRFGGPYYKEDYYSLSPSAAEWEATLIEGGFTHLYLRNTNDYFLTNYASLFENPFDIHNDSYYAIAQENGHLRFVYIGT